MRRWPLLAGLVFLLAPGVVLAPVWYHGGLGAGEDDVLYYYPSRQFFHDTIRAGHWPAWNPLTGLGRPYAADPQSALWYPFTWLFAVLPPGVAYPACLWLHYTIAGVGMYRLLRAPGIGRQAALLGGLAFAFSGFLVAHRAHFAMQNAAAWAPLLLWRMQRVAEGGGVRRVASAAVVGALQCLAGHVQIAALTALGGLVYLAAVHGLLRSVRVCALTWSIVGGLYAVQWVPTAAYLRECTRVDNDYWDFTENSWHPASAVTLLMPMLLGQRVPNAFDQRWWGPSHQVEQFAYPGLTPLLLAALTLRGAWRADRRRRGLAALGLFGLLLALGKFGPVCPILYWVPGASLFRVPARAVVLVNLAIAGLAACALHDLTAPLSPARVRLRALALAWTRRPLLVAPAAVGGVLLVVLTLAPLFDAGTRNAALRAVNPLRPAVWLPLCVGLLSLSGVRMLAAGWRRRGPAWPLTALTLLDLSIIGWTIDVPAGWPGFRSLLEPSGRREWLRHVDSTSGRLWVVADTATIYDDPIERGVANSNVLLGLASLTDYGPLQPRDFAAAFGFRPWGATDRAAELLRDAGWMRACNVGWVLLWNAADPPPAGGVPVASGPEGWRLFRCADAAGEAFVEPVDGSPATSVGRPRDAARVELEAGSPTRVVVRVRRDDVRRDLLVLSRLHLPGWTARCAGRALNIQTAHGLLMAVELPAGPADVVEIEWTYRTPMLRLGAALSGVTLAGLAFACLAGRRGRGAPGAARSRGRADGV